MTEFESKVKEMRESQKRYFATRSSESLKAAKNAEKAVDDMLHRIESEDRQMKFDFMREAGGGVVNEQF
jgi:hypothetical protein